jgi:hypothetical protein
MRARRTVTPRSTALETRSARRARSGDRCRGGWSPARSGTLRLPDLPRSSRASQGARLSVSNWQWVQRSSDCSATFSGHDVEGLPEAAAVVGPRLERVWAGENGVAVVATASSTPCCCFAGLRGSMGRRRGRAEWCWRQACSAAVGRMAGAGIARAMGVPAMSTAMVTRAQSGASAVKNTGRPSRAEITREPTTIRRSGAAPDGGPVGGQGDGAQDRAGDDEAGRRSGVLPQADYADQVEYGEDCAEGHADGATHQILPFSCERMSQRSACEDMSRSTPSPCRVSRQAVRPVESSSRPRAGPAISGPSPAVQ